MPHKDIELAEWLPIEEAKPAVFLHSFNNKPLITPEDFYHAYCEIGRLFHVALNPTPDEVKFINEEMIDIGIEDLLVDPKDQTSGDIGLLACLVYEHREAVKAEVEDDKDSTI